MGFDPLKRVNKIAATLYAFIEEKITKAIDFPVNKIGYPSADIVRNPSVHLFKFC
jgi:hypothetical protein